MAVKKTRPAQRVAELPEREHTMEAADALAQLIRLAALANAVQDRFYYSLSYRLGKWVSVTRRPRVLGCEDPHDVIGKDTRVADQKEMYAALRSMRTELAAPKGE